VIFRQPDKCDWNSFEIHSYLRNIIFVITLGKYKTTSFHFRSSSPFYQASKVVGISMYQAHKSLAQLETISRRSAVVTIY
jgi:hypothetical protein